MRISLVSICLAVCLIGPGWAQDQGIPDTVRIEGDTLYVGRSMPVRVAVANDRLIREFVFGLVSKSLDGGFAKADSVVFVNRMANPGVLEWRIVFPRDSDGVAPDSTMIAAFPVINPIDLPTGNDAILDIYLTGLNPGSMVVDSGWFPPFAAFGLVPLINGSYGKLYAPKFVTDTLTVVETGLPPLLTLPDDDPHTEAGAKVSFYVEADSPEDNPVTIELTGLTLLEGGTGTPVNSPSLSGNNPAHFSWRPADDDVGLWSAGFRACDATGLCTDGAVTIQVVSDDDYLVTFEQIETTDAPAAMTVVHGNTDDDLEAELFICSSGMFTETTASLWNLNDDLSFSDVYSYHRGRPFINPVVGYLNNDDYSDVVILSSLRPSLHVFYSDGDNAFWYDSIGLATVYSRSATLGEFTGDQYLDYVYVGYNGIYMCAGAADPVFLQPTSIDLGEVATSVDCADFDDDGLDDLAVGTESGLRIFLSDGDGGFQFVEFHSQTYGALDIEVTNDGSDFNHDGFYDLCLATPSIGGSHSEVVVYLGNGNGTFEQRVVRSPLGHVMANCAGDFNNDGDLDIAYVNGSRNHLALLFGDGDGSFTNELRYPVAHLHPVRMDCFDADVDGDLDLTVASTGTNSEGASLSIFENHLDPDDFELLPIVITALDNAELELRAPSGQVVNKVSRSIASGEYLRRNINHNALLDDGIRVGAVEPGTYQISVRPKPGEAMENETFSLALTVGGYRYRFAEKAPMPAEGFEFSLYPTSASPVYPPPGAYVYRSDLTFWWEGEGDYEFQLATDLLFDNVLLNAVVSGGSFPAPPLDTAVSDLYYWRIKPIGETEYSDIYPFNLMLADCLVRGNIDHDEAGLIALWDLVWLLGYMFKNGPEPPNIDEANVDGMENIDISDAVYLVDYLYVGGPAPPSCR